MTNNISHLTNGANIAGYISWGAHSSLSNNYAISANTNAVIWSGNSGWWAIQTVESYNGQRFKTDMGTFVQWYSSNAFGGIDYSNTPVGAISNVGEEGIGYNAYVYFGLWSGGKNFGICAWNSHFDIYPQAVGDPLVTK